MITTRATKASHGAVPGGLDGGPSHPEVPCGIAEWDAAVYGNHRFVVEVGHAVPAVRVEVPWRRHDPNPAAVDAWLVSERGRRIHNVVRGRVDAESGELIFEPADGPGEYLVYYLPYTHAGSAHYPRAEYRTVTPTADPGWVRRNRLHETNGRHGLPRARVVRYDAASEIDSFAGVGFAATRAEVEALAQAQQEPSFLLFGEDRSRGIGRAGYLPARWARAGAFTPLRVTADRGEFLAFQVGVYALTGLTDVQVDTTGLPFSARHLTGGGTDPHGRPTTRSIEVPQRWVQSLWIGLDVPADSQPGDHVGEVVVAAGTQRSRLMITVAVGERVLTDQGVADPARLARLAWLDDTLGHDDEVVAPYRPVGRTGRDLAILGRRIRLGDDGLPERLESTFTQTMTGVDAPARQILAAPVTLDVGEDLRYEPLELDRRGPATVTWHGAATGPGLTDRKSVV